MTRFARKWLTSILRAIARAEGIREAEEIALEAEEVAHVWWDNDRITYADLQVIIGELTDVVTYY